MLLAMISRQVVEALPCAGLLLVLLLAPLALNTALGK